MESDPKVLKIFSCSTQLSMIFFLLIHVKIVGILTLISREKSILGLFELDKKLTILIFLYL